jgi:IS4 transposase
MSRDLTGSDRSARVGTVYRRKVRVCTICDQRLDTTAARRACEGVGHRIDVREQRVWWIKYYADGGWRSVSSHSEDQQAAQDLLRAREGRMGS